MVMQREAKDHTKDWFLFHCAGMGRTSVCQKLRMQLIEDSSLIFLLYSSSLYITSICFLLFLVWQI